MAAVITARRSGGSRFLNPNAADCCAMLDALREMRRRRHVVIIEQEQKVGFLRLWIPLKAFPALLLWHYTEYNTAEVEQRGAEVATAGFPQDQLREFIRAVCRWGNYAGIAGRVLKRNRIEQLQETFSAAKRLLDDGQISAAVGYIEATVDSLAFSFASKHVKFLAPEKAVVLDEIISRRVGYTLDVTGYDELLADCYAMLDLVVRRGIPHPLGGTRSWRVSDMEMVLFAKLRTGDQIG
jgi:hypothetical protein